MNADEWIDVPKWDTFQHYKDRDPQWIKLYTSLNSNDKWCGLSTAERGMLCTLYVEFARSSGQLTVGKVMQLCGKSARSKHLKALSDAGFIRILASKPLAQRREEKIKRDERASAKPGEKQNHSSAKCPRCGIPLSGPRKLAEHLYLTHDGPEPAHWLEAEAKLNG